MGEGVGFNLMKYEGESVFWLSYVISVEQNKKRNNLKETKCTHIDPKWKQIDLPMSSLFVYM